MVLDLDSENVILEGIRRLKDFTRMYAGVGSLESVLRPADNADGLIYKLHLDERRISSPFARERRINVEQILAMSYLPNFETLRILFGLLAAGVVERGGSHESEKRGIELEYELQEVVEHYNRNFERVCNYPAASSKAKRPSSSARASWPTSPSNSRFSSRAWSSARPGEWISTSCFRI